MTTPSNPLAPPPSERVQPKPADAQRASSPGSGPSVLRVARPHASDDSAARGAHLHSARDPGSAAKKPTVVRRILVIDDNPAIHEDFRKLLCPKRAATALDETESALFGAPAAANPAECAFAIDTALQGREGVECVKRSLSIGQPYAMAFVDMRMPPGWDGVETAAHMWTVDPNVEVVVCSAYSDYSWNEVMKRLARPDRVRLLLKPFSSKDAIELAWERTNRWLARRRGDGGNEG